MMSTTTMANYASRRSLLLLTVLAPLLTVSTAIAKTPVRPRFDLSRPEIQDFIRQAAKSTGLHNHAIRALLAEAEPQASILLAMSRPAERVLPWWQYRARFLDERRIAAGVSFWEEHRDLLARIERERGVPAEYLLAIVGVETSYGRVMGRYRVLDALATLAFDFPTRAAYFRQELEQFLLMTREDRLNPLLVRGSYAGAMGAPQFMPSSYRRFAIDDDNKGHRDLWSDWSDVLASVANYFNEHGWRSGEAVLLEAKTSGEGDDPLAFELALGDTLGAIRARGYEVESSLPESTPAMLVPAEQAESMSWRVGFANFFVITRYNRSPRYAMAVHDLAQALRLRIEEAGVST
jgi:membrane-bound lytic murein transglycosylase B